MIRVVDMKKKYFIIASIIIVVLCICLCAPGLQNDTFYTIKIGDYIVHNGIDMQDHFSFHNLPYTYPHWLYDCLVYFIYFIGGFTGLYIFNIICYIALICLIFYFNYKNNSSKFLCLIFSVLSIFMLSTFIATRAQVMSYIIFVLEYIFITNYLKKPNKWYLIGLVVLSALLCNMHVAVWPFYFLVFLPFVVEKVIAKVIKRKKIGHIEINDYSHVKYLFLVMIIAIIPGFLTPIGDTPFTYLLKTMQGSSQEYILEHMQPALLEMLILGIYSLVLFILTMLGKIKLHQLFLVLGLTIMAFTSNRHMALYTIFIFPIMGVLLGNILDNCNIDVDKYLFKYILSNKGIVVMGICLVVMLGVYICSDKEYIAKDFYPVDATKFIKENLDYKNIRLLNEYSYGSYLIFNDIKVYIDSRADLYTKEFNGTKDIFMESTAPTYGKIAKDYEVTHIICEKGKILYNYASSSENFHLIYEDDYFAVYAKNE